MLTLNSSISTINKIGKATAKKLKSLDIETAEDLLLYFPFRYEDFSQLVKIKDLQVGQNASIVGQIELIQNKRSPRKRIYITEALVRDDTESVRVIWFNQPYIAKILAVGDAVSLAGRAEEDYGGLVLMSPVYEKVSKPPLPLLSNGGVIHTHGIIPNYHLTGNLTHKQLRFLIKSIIHLARYLEDWLPEKVRAELGLLPLATLT